MADGRTAAITRSVTPPAGESGQNLPRMAHRQPTSTPTIGCPNNDIGRTKETVIATTDAKVEDGRGTVITVKARGAATIGSTRGRATDIRMTQGAGTTGKTIVNGSRPNPGNLALAPITRTNAIRANVETSSNSSIGIKGRKIEIIIIISRKIIISNRREIGSRTMAGSGTIGHGAIQMG